MESGGGKIRKKRGDPVSECGWTPTVMHVLGHCV